MGIISKLFEWLFSSDKRKRRKNFKTGMKGERNVYNHLVDRGYRHCVIHDSILRDPIRGTMAQVDIMLITKDLALIIEVKTQNFRRISGHIDDESWNVTYGHNSNFKSNNIYQQALRQQTVVSSIFKRHGIYLPIRTVVLIQNNNNNVDIDIKGLDPNKIAFITSLERINWNSISPTPHKMALGILRGENTKNSYVRKNGGKKK